MISSKILIPVMIGLACVLALIVGSNLAMAPEQTITFVGMFAVVFVLMIFAREFWWFSLFLAIGFGGFAYFGFKIYAHECLLAIALAGLIPSIALNPRSQFADRPRLPWYFYVTFVYLVAQIFYSIAVNDARGFIEFGNIVRAYMYGLWPLLFIFFFRWYGRSSYLPFALYLLEFVYLVRGLLTFATLYFPMTSVLPGINFMLPGNTMNAGGLDDLRFVGHGICVVSCAILIGRPSPGIKLTQYFLLLFSCIALLMGGGRALLVTSMVAALAAIVAARMWKTLTFASVCAALFIGFLNIFPTSIEPLNWRFQRALSILIFDQGATYAHQVLRGGSDEFHEQIKKEGYRRWTLSSKTFLIGTGISPWKTTVSRETNIPLLKAAVVKGAADTGNYEAGLWTILAPTGLVGFLLYIATIGYFAWPNAIRLWRENPRGMNLTITFLGCYPAFEWLIFSPIQGTYPQIETLFVASAFYYLWDNRTAGRTSSEPLVDDEFSPYSDQAHA